jgi:hypothetical protein
MEIEPNKLGICPECDKIINLNDIKEIGNDAVVGCGLAENDLMRCKNCLCTYNDDKCKYIRFDSGLSLTTAKEMAEE